MRVFVLEDDIDLGYVMRRMLQSRGHECVVANSLAEGRAKLREGGFDVLLLDMLLPDGKGLELLGDAGMSANSDAAVFVVSGNVNEDLREDPRIAMCFQKPFMVRHLLDAVEAKR